MSEMIFEKLSENQLAQMEKDAIMIHEYDMNSCIETAKEEVREALEQERETERRKTICSLLKMNCSEESIAEMTGIPIEDVRRICFSQGE